MGHQRRRRGGIDTPLIAPASRVGYAKVVDRDVPHGDRRLEQIGLDLTNNTVRRIAMSGLTVDPPVEPPEGPHFHYDDAPSLFLRRRGRGPLWVAWDTNLLIDYFNHGVQLWNGDSLPDEVGEAGEELEGLQVVMSLWVIRDIRFRIPEGVLDDSKRKPLSPERRARRLHAWKEFELALQLVADEEHGMPAPTNPVVGDLDDRLRTVPQGNDRRLVEEAVRSGMHVFMTCDKGVQRARRDLEEVGLLIASPLDLLEELVGAGAMHCMFEPAYAYWPMPDQQRVLHLINALAEGIA